MKGVGTRRDTGWGDTKGCGDVRDTGGDTGACAGTRGRQGGYRGGCGDTEGTRGGPGGDTGACARSRRAGDVSQPHAGLRSPGHVCAGGGGGVRGGNGNPGSPRSPPRTPFQPSPCPQLAPGPPPPALLPLRDPRARSGHPRPLGAPGRTRPGQRGGGGGGGGQRFGERPRRYKGGAARWSHGRDRLDPRGHQVSPTPQRDTPTPPQRDIPAPGYPHPLPWDPHPGTSPRGPSPRGSRAVSPPALWGGPSVAPSPEDLRGRSRAWLGTEVPGGSLSPPGPCWPGGGGSATSRVLPPRGDTGDHPRGHGPRPGGWWRWGGPGGGPHVPPSPGPVSFQAQRVRARFR